MSQTSTKPTLIKTAKPARTLSIAGLGEVSTGLLGFATLVGFLGPWWWFFDLFSHFRLQYFGASLILVVILGLKRSKTLTGILGGLALINLLVLQPWVLAENMSHRPPRLRIIWWNVQSANSQQEAAVDWILSQGADLVALGEISPPWEPALSRLNTHYPHQVTAIRQDNFGLGLYSKSPVFEPEWFEDREDFTPTLRVSIQVDGRALDILITHPRPPIGHQATQLRNAQLNSLAGAVSQRGQHTVLVGDLNTTPWNHAFRSFLRESQLTRHRVGLQPTWPAKILPLRIPLDHCLTSTNLTITRFQVGPPTGSDHAPLLIDLSW